MTKNDNLAMKDREDMIGWNCGLTGSWIIYMDPPILLESFGKPWMRRNMSIGRYHACILVV